VVIVCIVTGQVAVVSLLVLEKFFRVEGRQRRVAFLEFACAFNGEESQGPVPVFAASRDGVGEKVGETRARSVRILRRRRIGVGRLACRCTFAKGGERERAVGRRRVCSPAFNRTVVGGVGVSFRARVKDSGEGLLRGLGLE
jgi:hypothetical protein